MTVGPVDATQIPRYAGDTTFARLPRLSDVGDADTVVWGVPFDGGVSYRPGARFGPNHIRQSSRLLRPYNPANDTEPFNRAQVADAGDLGANPFSLDEAIASIETGARELSGTSRTLLTIGGDHTIALPLLRVQAERHGPIAVLHFDAHLDTWDTYFGAPYTHGTPFRRASEEGLIDFTHAMHMGIRGPLYSKLDLDESEALGFSAVHARDFVRSPIDDIINRMRERLGDRPVYVSLDVDVLDPAFAPRHRHPRGRPTSCCRCFRASLPRRPVRLGGGHPAVEDDGFVSDPFVVMSAWSPIGRWWTLRVCRQWGFSTSSRLLILRVWRPSETFCGRPISGRCCIIRTGWRRRIGGVVSVRGVWVGWGHRWSPSMPRRRSVPGSRPVLMVRGG